MAIRASDVPNDPIEAHAWLAMQSGADENELRLIAEVAERHFTSTRDPSWAELAVDALRGVTAIEEMRLRVRLILITNTTIENGGAFDPRIIIGWICRQLEHESISDYVVGLSAMSHPPSDASSDREWIDSVVKARSIRAILRLAADLNKVAPLPHVIRQWLAHMKGED